MHRHSLFISHSTMLAAKQYSYCVYLETQVCSKQPSDTTQDVGTKTRSGFVNLHASSSDSGIHAKPSISADQTKPEHVMAKAKLIVILELHTSSQIPQEIAMQTLSKANSRQDVIQIACREQSRSASCQTANLTTLQRDRLGICRSASLM